jgi:hypothetical protein
MADFRNVDSDRAKPTEIAHECAEIFDRDTLVQEYNYIVYHFDRDGRCFWARTYKEEIDTVFVYGPFDGRSTMNQLSGPLDDVMLSYFKRRFGKIDTLGSDGYVVIWSR